VKSPFWSITAIWPYTFCQNCFSWTVHTRYYACITNSRAADTAIWY